MIEILVGTRNSNKRIAKGKSLLDSIDDYTIIDIETTGLDPNFNEIIELSAIKVRNNKIVEEYSTLVKPEENLDEFIKELTGITDEMLKDKPTIENALNEYLNFIGDDIIIGHNVNFDINFLYDNSIKYYNKPIENDFIDTLRMSRKYLSLENNKLVNVAKALNVDISGAHRALNDCYIVYGVYNILKEKIKNYVSEKDNKIKEKNIRDFETKNDSNIILNPLFQKQCVVTGTLEKMSRDECHAIISKLGGIISNTVNKKTNFLILGNNDYNPILRGKKSNKQIKAEQAMLKGQDIQIISENVFYDIIDDYIKI